jgi:hypothetical protein
MYPLLLTCDGKYRVVRKVIIGYLLEIVKEAIFVPIADCSKGDGEGTFESLDLLRCRKTRFRRHYAAVITSLMEETAHSTDGRDARPVRELAVGGATSGMAVAVDCVDECSDLE